MLLHKYTFINLILSTDTICLLLFATALGLSLPLEMQTAGTIAAITEIFNALIIGCVTAHNFCSKTP